MDRFFRYAFATLLLITSACADPVEPRDRTSLPDATVGAAAPSQSASLPRIVFLGDSLTAGYGLAQDEAVPSLIQKRLNEAGYHYQVVNAGVSGDTSAGGLRRLDWSLDGDVRVLVVELGANDGLRGLPPAEMKRNLAAIVTKAQQRRITVLLTGMEAPPNYGASYTSEFRQVYRSIAAEYKTLLVPFFLEGVAGIPSLNIADGLHPNAKGAQIVERTIWRALEPLLARQATK